MPEPASYASGAGTAIVESHGFALVDAPADATVVQRLATLLRDGGTLRDVASILIGSGVDAMPTLACVIHDGDDVALLLRGHVAATVRTTPEAEESIAGSELNTWREEHRSDVTEVTLTLVGAPDEDGPADTATPTPFTTTEGVAPAVKICRPLAARPLPPEPADLPASAAEQNLAPSPEEAVVDLEAGVLAEPPPLLGADSVSPGGEPATRETAADGSEGEPAGGEGPPAVGFADPPAERPNESLDAGAAVAGDTPIASSDDDEFEFGHLLGHTRYREVEQAAVREEAEPAGVEAASDAPAAAAEDLAHAAINAPGTAQTPTPASAPTPAPGDAAIRFCEQCGTKRTATEAFCMSCGAPFADAAAPASAPPPAGPPSGGTDAAGVRPSEETRIFTDIAAVQAAEPPAPSAPAGAPLPAGPPAAGGGLIQGIPGMPLPAGEPPTSDPAPRPFVAPSTAMPSAVPSSPAASQPAGPSTYFSRPLPSSPDDAAPGYEESPTMSVAALRAQQAAAAASSNGDTSESPVVQAVRCPGGHPNPPHVDACRTCGAEITDRSVVSVARPPLGWLAFSDGQEVCLDRHVVVGRNPARLQLVNGEQAAVVRIADPDKLLSRTHVEVRLVDWQVHIVDRDSMNHTFVQLPGRTPMQLRPAEACPIPPGTLVNLGDVVSFVYRVNKL